MDTGNKQTLADVNRILTLAKKSEADIIPTSQTIYFTNDTLRDGNYKFLELDKHLCETLQQGQSLLIKGADADNVVLCSDTHTYDVTAAETSNSLLLTKNLKFFKDVKDNSDRNLSEVTVFGISHEYLAATLTKPHLNKLWEILNKTIYKGSELEYTINENDLVTEEDLKGIIQCSDKELELALKSMNIVQIDGKIRLLGFEYHFRVLSHMLKLIDENSWALDEIDYDETLNALQDLIPRDIIDAIFEKYTSETKIIDSQQFYQYKEDDICRATAEAVLHETGKFNLDEFLQTWQESVPEGMVTKEEHLYGIAIVDRKSIPNRIFSYPETDLPEDINERFDALFKIKEKWTVPEIAPYIQRLATAESDVNAILAKHARASTVDGVKYYSAKHSK